MENKCLPFIFRSEDLSPLTWYLSLPLCTLRWFWTASRMLPSASGVQHWQGTQCGFRQSIFYCSTCFQSIISIWNVSMICQEFWLFVLNSFFPIVLHRSTLDLGDCTANTFSFPTHVRLHTGLYNFQVTLLTCFDFITVPRKPSWHNHFFLNCILMSLIFQNLLFCLCC